MRSAQSLPAHLRPRVNFTRAAFPLGFRLGLVGQLACALLALALVTIAASAQPATGDAIRDPLAMQKAREARVAARGEQVFHTNNFDLSGLPVYKPEQKASGKLRIWGLNYLGDCGLATVWADGFRNYQPDVEVEYHLPTALVAIPGLICGTADLGAVRPITFDERLTFQRVFSADPVEIKMVTGSYDVPGYATTMAIIVNKANPLSKLSLAQLDGIFGTERTGGYRGITWHPEAARGPEKNIRTWGQLGLTGEWRDQPINVYMTTLRFHYPPVFEDIVLSGGDKWNEHLREYNNYLKADGSGWYSHGQQIMDEVGKDRYGIAVSWVAYMTPQTKAIAIGRKEGGPFAEMTIENVQNGSYPLAYNEWWCFYRKPGCPVEPKIKEYLRYVLSREAQEAVTKTGKFLPLTADVVREELKKLE